MMKLSTDQRTLWAMIYTSVISQNGSEAYALQFANNAVNEFTRKFGG